MAWTTVFTLAMTFNVTGQENGAIRNIAPSISIGGSAVRVTFVANDTSTSQFGHMSVGVRSASTANCTAIPSELKIAGASGWTGSAGATVVSDPAPLLCSAGDSLLIDIDFAATNGNCKAKDTDPGGSINAYRNTAGNPSYNLQNMAGAPVLNGGAIWTWGMSKVEVWNPDLPLVDDGSDKLVVEMNRPQMVPYFRGMRPRRLPQPHASRIVRPSARDIVQLGLSR